MKLNDSNNIFNQFQKKKGQVAVLIDPDKYTNLKELDALLKKTSFADVDYLFVEEVPFCEKTSFL